MPAKKQYADPAFYESKLSRVMARLGIEDGKYDWDFNRQGGWVSFWYKGQYYRFDHSVAKAKEHNQSLSYGSDAFAQIVLALEDLTRLVERGIYDLQTWVEGMKCLPETTGIPEFFSFLGFTSIPSSTAEVEKQYRKMAHAFHPDTGGSDESFTKLQQAKEQAVKYLEKK